MSVHYIKGDQPTTVNMDDEKETLVFIRGGKGNGSGKGIPKEVYYTDESGYAYSVKVVELTDECIERIAEAVVRKMNEPKEERTCGNCKWSVGKDEPETYVVCKNKDRYIMPKAVDMFNKGCERWEKE